VVGALVGLEGAEEGAAVGLEGAEEGAAVGFEPPFTQEAGQAAPYTWTADPVRSAALA